MLELIFVWAALLIALIVFAIGKPREGGALTLAYFLGLSLIHVPGCLAYLNGIQGSTDFENTRVGFEVTLIGMAAFVAGAIWVRLTHKHGTRTNGIVPSIDALERLGWHLIVTGMIAYFIVAPLAGFVPSATSFLSSIPTMLVLGLWLRFYCAELAGSQRQTVVTLALLPLLPLGTLVMGGFIGYGVNWVLSSIAFFYVIARKRILFYLTAPLVAYLGLSLFVTYMGQREGIRDIIWYQNADVVVRFDRVSTIFTEFQLLDLNLYEHTNALDGRLNQNKLVGAGVERYQEGQVNLSYGRTVPLWTLIPRVIWPDKPSVGGSSDVVSEFTGIQFAVGTSVGIGQVLEFYMNFGIVGVITGFLTLGALLSWLDLNIMKAIAIGDSRGLILNGLPGLTLLQPGGSLMEMLVALVAAFLGAHALLYLNYFSNPSLRSRPASKTIIQSNRALHGQ